MRKITIISTGGTIEKTYNELSGELTNKVSVLPRMLAYLRLEDTEIDSLELMHKDSLTLTDVDRDLIVEAVRALDADHTKTGVVILHGTDTLETTGERLHADIPEPRIPIVLTGAMRPYEMKRSDALQNLTEALFAAGEAEPGVCFAGHGKLLRFPGVVKDRERGTFLPRS